MDFINWEIVKNPLNWALVLVSLVLLCAIMFFLQPNTDQQ